MMNEVELFLVIFFAFCFGIWIWAAWYADDPYGHKPIIPEPNGMLAYSKESALLADWEKAAFGDEEE